MCDWKVIKRLSKDSHRANVQCKVEELLVVEQLASENHHLKLSVPGLAPSGIVWQNLTRSGNVWQTWSVTINVEHCAWC